LFVPGYLNLCEGNVTKYQPSESEQVISLGTIEVAATATLPEVIVSLAGILVVSF